MDCNVLLFHVRYLTGTVNSGIFPDKVAGVVTAQSGNSTWAGAVKLYFSEVFAGDFLWSHICGTINDVQVGTLCLRLCLTVIAHRMAGMVPGNGSVL